MLISRRLFLTSTAALALAGCKPRPSAAPDAKAPPSSLAKVINGDWRLPADKARDAWRHPAESLAFWGLQPGMTVVEVWPGAGWYTDILAPFLESTNGRLYEALQPANDPAEPAAAQMDTAFTHKLKERRRLYGDVHLTEFGPRSGPVAPAGTADLVLFLRNIHNWMAAGVAEKAFRDAYAALKPGGVLGVEEHRASPGGVQDPLAGDGYVQESYVKQLAVEAGFVFDKASEINANPMDDHNHPFGVWTLPPVRRSAPAGKPDDLAFDHGPYDAVGESDRMTLRFTKKA
jgi:predicted methyltransferase